MTIATHKNTLRKASGLKDIIAAGNIKGIILDIFGVLHNGQNAFKYTPSTLQNLKNNGIKICLLSNTPRNADNTRFSLNKKGILSEHYDHIITSGETASLHMNGYIANYGRNCWFVSNSRNSKQYECLYNHLDQVNIVDSPGSANFFIVSNPSFGITDTRMFDTLVAQLQIAADKNLPMICTNPDLIVDVGSVREYCAGTFAKKYENMGGSVEYIGKPHAPVYDQCFNFFAKHNITPDQIAAMGDTPHTDIDGAKNNGVHTTIFNCAGIHRQDVSPNGAIDMKAVNQIFAGR